MSEANDCRECRAIVQQLACYEAAGLCPDHGRITVALVDAAHVGRLVEEREALIARLARTEAELSKLRAVLITVRAGINSTCDSSHDDIWAALDSVQGVAGGCYE